VLKPEPQHRAIAGERKIAQLLGQRDRLACDHILSDGGGRVDPRRPPGGIAGLPLDPAPAARPGLIGRRCRERRLGRRRQLGKRPLLSTLSLFHRDFLEFDLHLSS
jgi:hypothetical protein